MAGRSATDGHLALPQSDTAIAKLDNAELTPRFWFVLVVLAFQFTLEYFDFFVVGYLVAVIGPQWKITFGQSSIMLLSAGVGTILGSLVFGRLADVWGRKPMIIMGTTLYSLCAGAISLVPDGAWILFSVLRFLVGVGLGAAATAQNAIIVEIAPTRYRTVIGSAMNAPVTIGVLIAALSSATLLDSFGWRGLAAVGVFPIIVAVLIAFVVPESIRWLVANNQFDKAHRNAAWLLNVPVASMSAPTTRPSASPKASLSDLYKEPARFWSTIVIWLLMATAVNGILQWGPTIIALLMKIPPREAAKYFIIMAVSALVLRLPFLVLAQNSGADPVG